MHQQYLLVEPQVVQRGARANTDVSGYACLVTLMYRRFLLGASSSWDVHRMPDRSDTAIVGRGRERVRIRVRTDFDRGICTVYRPADLAQCCS